MEAIRDPPWLKLINLPLVYSFKPHSLLHCLNLVMLIVLNPTHLWFKSWGHHGAAPGGPDLC